MEQVGPKIDQQGQEVEGSPTINFALLAKSVQ